MLQFKSNLEETRMREETPATGLTRRELFWRPPLDMAPRPSARRRARVRSDDTVELIKS